MSLTQPSAVPDSKVQVPQPLPHDDGNAYPAHLHDPVWHVRLAPQMFPHEPQLVLSLPFTLIQPLAPQSVAVPEQLHVPFEQVLPPVQSVLLAH